MLLYGIKGYDKEGEMRAKIISVPVVIGVVVVSYLWFAENLPVREGNMDVQEILALVITVITSLSIALAVAFLAVKWVIK